jgi:hypothetical protein
MLGALAIDVRAAQSDVAQHAVVELQEQVSAPRAFSPSPKPAQQIRNHPARSSGLEDSGQPTRRETQLVSIQSLWAMGVVSFIRGRVEIKLTQNDSSIINLSP